MPDYSHQPQSRNTSKCLAAIKQINGMSFVHTMQYHLTIKINLYKYAIHIHGYLLNTVRERSHMVENNSIDRQVQKDRKEMVVTRSWDRRGGRSRVSEWWEYSKIDCGAIDIALWIYWSQQDFKWVNYVTINTAIVLLLTRRIDDAAWSRVTLYTALFL